MLPHPNTVIEIANMRYDEVLAEAAQMRRATLAAGANGPRPSVLLGVRTWVGTELIRLGASLRGEPIGPVTAASPFSRQATSIA